MKEYLSCYGNIEVVGDGDSLCARFDDFVNLHESPTGFGSTDAEALAGLAQDLRQELAEVRVGAELRKLPLEAEIVKLTAEAAKAAEDKP